MWLVRLALRRPYTVTVMSVVIVVLGILSLSRMIVDIFPAVDLPVVVVVWNYPGLSPEDMERRVVFVSERSYSTTVNGIQKIESQSIPGIGMIKVYFHPGTQIGGAIAQISAASSTVLRSLPPGMQPPTIIQFNASNVPVAQLTARSDSMPEEKVYDYALNFIRVRLFSVPGLSVPAPFGGKTRQVMIETDPGELASRGLSPADVVSALRASNVIIPAGTARIGDLTYNVGLNSSPNLVDEFKTIPVKLVRDAVITLGDVARVSDSYAQQTNIVRVNGSRATFLAILKHADASTLAVVDAARELLPQIKAVAPQGLELKLDFDQSVFVRAAISGVVQVVVLASVLVSLLVLIFLGDWRAMLTVVVSIPLAICAAIIGLNLAGHSINLMSIGGLALAIGILVDNATVTVENVHRNRELGKPLTIAILDGAGEVSEPTLVATLAICVVFFPVVLLYGAAKFLFVPLALSVVIAMLASYLLSRTLVPAVAFSLMSDQGHTVVMEESQEVAVVGGPSFKVGTTNTVRVVTGGGEGPPPPPGPPRGRFGRRFQRFNTHREDALERFHAAYVRLLETALRNRAKVLILSGAFTFGSLALLLVIGTDFFPSVDAGLMKLHFRAPSGTRIEETERLVAQVEKKIRSVVPAEEISTVNAMIGVPGFTSLAFVQTENVGEMDADILVALNKHHHPTSIYRQKLREVLARDFPGCSFYFQAADIITQVLNFGLTSALDVEIEDLNFGRSYQYAKRLRDAISQVPGTADVHVKQVLDYPTIHVEVDRVRAGELGMTQKDVADSVLVGLSSSSIIAPSFYLNPDNNVNYPVAVQIPLNKITSTQSLANIPLTPSSQKPLFEPTQAAIPRSELPRPGQSTIPSRRLPRPPVQTLTNVAHTSHTVGPENVSHYRIQRVLSVDANVEGRDLGSVAGDIERKISELNPLPPGTHITLRGQNEIMSYSFRSLGLGLALAILLVFLLMTVLFQSWMDPFVIMMAIPGALAGILWMLALTGTTINVESLMGSIMAVGIATKNSILVVSFANQIRVETGASAWAAALEAGKTRFRPVLMTALAIVIGMLPMALGMGEGGEQNAPLGRAVIGGLILATAATLLLIPVIYSLLRTKLPNKHLLEEQFLAGERGEMVR